MTIVLIVSFGCSIELVKYLHREQFGAKRPRVIIALEANQNVVKKRTKNCSLIFIVIATHHLNER